MKMKTLMYSLGLLAISGLIARADLIHQWTFANTNNLNDVVTGTANRLAYRLANTITNPVFSTDTPFGTGNALSEYSLDMLQQSNNCYVVGSNTGTFTPTNMTFAAWVKINGWTATDDQWEAIFSQLDTGAGAGFRLSRISNLAYSGVDFQGVSALSARDNGSQVNIADNNWHHVAFTYSSSSSNLTYFVDGVQKAQVVTPYYPTTGTFLSIGAYSTAGNRSMNGLIYDVRIYDAALPAWQIASLTNKPNTVLFSDNFDAAVSTSLFDPTGRAAGTLSTNTLYYAWADTNNVVVNSTLSWAADLATNGNNELITANGNQNLRFGSSANSGYFDWYPYVGGQTWNVDYDTLTGNSQPLNLGVTETQLNGAWNGYLNAAYNLSFGNVGVGARFGPPSNGVANIFPSRATIYHIRVQFNELLGKATMYVNGTSVATNNLVFNSNHRYISWGEPTKFGGYLDNVQVSVEPSIPVVPFAIIPAASNLVPNGNFTQVANAIQGSGPIANSYNLNGSHGDFSSLWGSTADLVGWSPYSSDPYGLTTNCVPFTDDPSYVLNGTFYLDTLINTVNHAITLNSALYYLNGLIQTNILNAVTIKSGAQYQFAIQAGATANTVQSYATFAAGLTVGSGANATNSATAVPNSAFSLWAQDLPTSGTTNITSLVSGADLLAAQGNGPVNLIFNQVNSNGIANYPTSPDPKDVTQVSQVKVYGVGLTVVIPANDLNHDGVVDQADVTLAQLYLDGNGGDSATNRQNTLINTYGFSSSQALSYLNLTGFDIDSNGYFDASDVAALQAIVAPLTPPTLNYSVVAPGQIQFNWSGAFKLQWLTNPLSAGLSGTWVDYPVTSNPVTVTNNGTVPSAFFRLTQ